MTHVLKPNPFLLLLSISLVFLFIFSTTTIPVNAASPYAWRSRTIYQVLTDRFALSSSSSSSGCPHLQDYCGGSWDGIREHLDYIQGMGFDALWISPVVANTPGGYHGFWLQDLHQLNEHFGDSTALKQLVDAAHGRGMYVMFGAVMNHVGPVDMDFKRIAPFSAAADYHPKCQIRDWNNQHQVEVCRLANLPDLNQSHPFVHDTLLQWTSDITAKYSFDGIRLDTVPEVSPDFWRELKVKAAPDREVYTVGEVFNGSPSYNARYARILTGVLSYPLYFTLRSVFAHTQSMYQIQQMQEQYQHAFGADALPYLAPFIDNHDNPRFLHEQSDMQRYKGALTFTLMSEGIPIVYYGTEQGFAGGADPHNREPLWSSGYNTNSDLYQFLRKVIHVRKNQTVWEHPQIQRYADDSFYAFTRGNVLVATTNVGSNGPQIVRKITYHPYNNGTKLCNIFWPQVDCITVKNGAFKIYLDQGESKIYTIS